MSGYRDLRVWKQALVFARLCYALAARLPCEETALRDQLRRAASSVSHNIAEGNACASRAEYRRYLAIARASANEARSQLQLAVALGYVTPDDIAAADDLADAISATLWKMRKRLERG